MAEKKARPSSQVIDNVPATQVVVTRAYVDVENLGKGRASKDKPVIEKNDWEVRWEGVDDAENPRNWPLWYKGFVLLAISWTNFMVVIVSSGWTPGISQMAKDFRESEIIVTVGLTTYLLGWVAGSLVLAPLSELYGRRIVYLVSTTLFVILCVPCALANSASGEIVARLFAGIAGAGSVALSPGTLSDVANDEQRALAYSIWSLGPFTAPAIGPIIGGFSTQYLNWRWINWIVMAGSGAALFMLISVRESYAPVLLRRKAARLRKRTGKTQWWSRFDSQLSVAQKLWISLTRPFLFALTEPMLLFWNTYIGLIYGVMYLSFTAYPVVFQGHRGWPVSLSGLSFAGFGVGSLLCIISAPLIRRVISHHRKDPDTGKPPPEAAISIICIAAVLLPVGEFWFAWTALPPKHWVWPILAGVPYGLGATANFIYSLNYLAHSYGIYAASVMAGNTVWRCVLGGTLPLAGSAMFQHLGADWAGTLLGFLLTAMAPIPFLFYRYGAAIRSKSTVIAAAREEEMKLRGK